MKEKQTSALRRVDGLGRIVLPKELRQKFHLNCGCQVIVQNDGDAIIVKAFNKIDEHKLLAKNLSKCFDGSWKTLFCSPKCIVAKTFQPASEDELFALLKRQEKMVIFNSTPKLFDGQKTLAIFPVFVQGDWVGSLVLSSSKFVQNFDFVLPVLKLLELSLET